VLIESWWHGAAFRQFRCIGVVNDFYRDDYLPRVIIMLILILLLLARQNNIIIYYAGTSVIILLHFQLMELKYYNIFTIDPRRFNYCVTRFFCCRPKSIRSEIIIVFHGNFITSKFIILRHKREISCLLVNYWI